MPDDLAALLAEAESMIRDGRILDSDREWVCRVYLPRLVIALRQRPGREEWEAENEALRASRARLAAYVRADDEFTAAKTEDDGQAAGLTRRIKAEAAWLTARAAITSEDLA